MNSFNELKLLTPWLKSNLAGGVFKKSRTPGKDVWEADIEVGGQVKTLVLGTSQRRIALFLEREGDAGGADRGGSKVTRSFFEALEGCRLYDVRMAPDDRLIALDFEGGMRLVFVLFGPGANVLMVGPAGKLLERFRKAARDPDPTLLGWLQGMPGAEGADGGGKQPDAEGADDGGAVASREVGEGAQGVDRLITDPRELRGVMLAADPRLPREHLGRLIEARLPEGSTESETRGLARQIGDAIRERPEFRVLADGRSCLIPADLLPDPASEAFPDVNAMIRHAFRRQGSEDRFTSRKKSAADRLSALLTRRRFRLRQLGNEDLTNERAEAHESAGHVVLAHAHEPTPADGVLRVDDPYEPGHLLEVALDPKRSMAENARAYYAKAEKARASIRIHRAMRRDTEREIGELERAMAELEEVRDMKELRAWQSRHGSEIKEPGPSMPYRELEVMGFRIWIGKSAQENDEMLKRCHKEDLWLHARGVAGSHVVIRMEQRKQDPPKQVVERAASFAAWHSKSRGSSLVPVIVSRRKYVVKSKGSAPGAVRVLKENVVHVPPAEPPGAAERDGIQ